MATQAKSKGEPSTRKLGGKASRPGQGASCNHLETFSSPNGTLLEVDEVEVFIPASCSRLEVQPRLCGDHYAEIHGAKFCVASVGPDRPTAVRNALAKVPA